MAWVLLSLWLLVVVVAVQGFRIVRQSEAVIVERLGRYNATLTAGVNIIWPLIDRPRRIVWRVRTTDVSGRVIVKEYTTTTVDLREQVFDFPEQQVITRDNVVIEVNGLLYYQVTDPKRAVYEVANLPNAIEKLAQTTLRSIIGEMDLDETLSGRDSINAKMRAVLDEATDKWGVRVNRVEIQDISPPANVRETMELQMSAERQRRARILQAEGVKQAQILEAEGRRDAAVAEAEGEKQARLLRAEGEAKALERLAAALPEGAADALRFQLALTYLRTLKDIGVGKGGDKTVFLPFEAADVLAGIGGLRELMGRSGGE